MNFDKEIRNILKNAGVKLSESKASEDWEKEFAERNGVPSIDYDDDIPFDNEWDEDYNEGYIVGQDCYKKGTCVHNDEECSDYWWEGYSDGYNDAQNGIDKFDEPKLVHNDEEYQRGADEYWRTYLQQKKNTEGLTPQEEQELEDLEAKYKRSLN